MNRPDDTFLAENWEELFTLAEVPTKRSAAAGIVTNEAPTQRQVRQAAAVEPGFGPFAQLPGTWSNVRPDGLPEDSPFHGRGWNLIALPFAPVDQNVPQVPFAAGEAPPFRLLMNRYNERLVFSTIDDDVPNRGISQDRQSPADQLVATLDYEQKITQILADDRPLSGLAGTPGTDIHHEPGLFLLMKNQLVDGLNIARLGTIPHGNALTALGMNVPPPVTGPPVIPDLSGLPEGVTDDILSAVLDASDPASKNPRDRYLHPYNHYINEPFDGLFSPQNANQLLQRGLPDNVIRTTVLDFNTDVAEAGIANIPFIERQADTSFMKSTFWLMELDEPAPFGQEGNRLVLAYSQFVSLDFFPRFDGRPGLIKWPHISINMMEKIAGPPANPVVDPVY